MRVPANELKWRIVQSSVQRRNDVMPYQRVRIVSHRADDLETASLFFSENSSAGVSPLCPHVWHRLSFSASTHTPDNEPLASPRQHVSIVSSKNDGRLVSRFKRDNNIVPVLLRIASVATRFARWLRNFYLATGKQTSPRWEKPSRVNALYDPSVLRGSSSRHVRRSRLRRSFAGQSSSR